MGHGLLGPDPWPAAPGPSRTGTHDEANAETLGFADGVGEAGLPFFAEHVDFAPRDADVDLEEEDIPDPRFFHGFQVGRHGPPVADAERPVPHAACRRSAGPERRPGRRHLSRTGARSRDMPQALPPVVVAAE